uniref:non-specific serine/threonine protein kinase n=1 Tax=Trypanosoma congolense (strain IL3000) TaxID=1068625 RepID=G0UVE2_TRYCI|nr:putative serine/threonine-protein kinase [Trypanosoma congolense IL3000]
MYILPSISYCRVQRTGGMNPRKQLKNGVLSRSPLSVPAVHTCSQDCVTGGDSAEACEPHPSRWERFPRGRQIGGGSYGNVFLSKDNLPQSEWFGKMVAVKVIPLQRISDKEVFLSMNEVAILKHVRHLNVLRYVDCFIDDEQQLCLVTEYATGGDMSMLVRRRAEGGVLTDLEYAGEGRRDSCELNLEGTYLRCGSERGGCGNARRGLHGEFKATVEEPLCWIESFRIVDLVRQCLDGLDHLHSHGIIHRDVKPSNVYLTESGVVKIGDFGVSKLVGPDDPLATTFIGTPFYICPELCLGEPYSFGADIWALGVLTYELYCMKLPFAADNVLAQIHVVTEGHYDRAALHSPHVFSPKQLQILEMRYGSGFAEQEKTLHYLVVTLVERMLVMDPVERPTAVQLLREFFVATPSRCPTPAEGSRPISSYVAGLYEMYNEIGNGKERMKAHPLPPRLGEGGGYEDPSSCDVTALSPLATRVSHTYDELVSWLTPIERQTEVLLLSGRQCQSFSASLRPSTSHDATGAFVVYDDAADTGEATHQIINARVNKIPWLRHAEAFSRLSLCEGCGGEVVRVDWGDDGNFTLQSPRRHRNSSSMHCTHHVAGGVTAEGRWISAAENCTVGDAGPLMTSVTVADGKLMESSERLELTLKLDESPQRKLSSPWAANRQEGPQSEKEQIAAEGGYLTAGRCRGYSTQTLEAILRQKIMASHLSRHRKLRALREAQIAREEEGRRLRAELSELFAKSFADKSLHIRTNKGCSTCPPDPLQMTQAPARVAEMTKIGLNPIGTALRMPAGIEHTIDQLTEYSCRKGGTEGGAAAHSTILTSELARIAADAAAVAARCAAFAVNPPARLDFRKFQGDSMDCSFSSSVDRPRRGVDTSVYNIPLSLYIVRSETDVTYCRTSITPDVRAGVLALPMNISLRPVRCRTRLRGVVWRVKEALTSSGMDHALLFPLDIHDEQQVGAEELCLRYVDGVGDVVSVSEPSDWVYVLRDWHGGRRQPWLQLWMVAT